MQEMNFRNEKGASSSEYISVAIVAMFAAYVEIHLLAAVFNFEIPLIGLGEDSGQDALTKAFDSFSVLQIFLLIPGIVVLLVAGMIISAVVGMAIFALVGFAFWRIIKIIEILLNLKKKKDTSSKEHEPISENSDSTQEKPQEILLKQKAILAKENKNHKGVAAEKNLLVGFRRWGVTPENDLESIAFFHLWRSKIEISECSKCKDESPKATCSCGLYAWDITNFNYSDIYMSRREALRSLLGSIQKEHRPPELFSTSSIEAIVVGSGRAQVHTKDGNVSGWRCQNQQIIGFISYSNDISEEKLQAVCKKYDVPMIRTEKQLRLILEHLQTQTKTQIPIEQIVRNLSIENAIRSKS